MSSAKSIGFLSSITTKITALLFFAFVLIIALVFYIVNLEGFDKVRTESDKLIIQNGENTIKLMSLNLSSATHSASQLRDTSKIASLNKASLNQALDQVFNKKNYNLLGSGGIWPDAYKLDPDVQSAPMVRFKRPHNKQPNSEQVGSYIQSNIDGIDLEYLNAPWFNLVKNIKTSSCIWDHITLKLEDKGFSMRCALSIERNDKFWGAATVNFTLDSIQMAVDSLSAHLGSGYAIVIDNSNQIIASTAPKRLPYIDKTTGEMMILSEFATIHPEWLPIERIISQKRKQIISQMAMRLPRKTVNQLNDYDDLYGSMHGTMLINAAASIKNNNSQSLTSRNAYMSSHVFVDEKLSSTKAKAYIFEVPETLWKLVIIKPTDEINTIADNLGNSLIRYLVFALIITAATVFLFIDTLVLRPLRKTTRRATAARKLLDKSQYEQLSTIKFEENRQDEIGFINKQLNELLKHIKYTEAELDEANKQLHLGEEEYIARLKKTLEPKDSSLSPHIHTDIKKQYNVKRNKVATPTKLSTRFKRLTQTLRKRFFK